MEALADMRLIRFILISAAFLGGYYLGHRPGSPDIFGIAGDLWQQVRPADDASSEDVATDAGEDLGTPSALRAEGDTDPTILEAAMAYLKDQSRNSKTTDASKLKLKEEDLWGYTRPTPRK